MSSSARAGFVVAASLSAGLLLAVMEIAAILSQPGAAVASPMDLAMLATWLTAFYGAAAGVAALAGALTLSRWLGFTRVFMTIAGGLALLMWLRPLARLGEGTPSHIPLEMLLALSAAGAGLCLARLAARPGGWIWIGGLLAALAVLLVQSRSVPGPFGRPLPPPALAIRLGLALAAGAAWVLLAWWLRPRRWAGPLGWVLAAAGILWLVFAGAGLVALTRRTPDPVPIPPAGATAAEAHADKRPNIILISIDTLRADHLSCYGYPRATSPAIDRLAAEGIRFERTASTASFTLPAHASMMTGLFPTSHGATYQNRDPRSFTVSGIGPEHPTLAGLLRDAGYDTAGFVSGPLMSRQFGFSRGFQWYDDRYDRLQSARARLLSRTVLFRVLSAAKIFNDRDLDSQRIAGEMNPLVLSWLRQRGHSSAGRPFFLFVHYWDPHAPYDPPAPWGRSDDGSPLSHAAVEYDMDRLLTGDYTMTPPALADTLALYDGEISYVDQQVGLLIDAMRQSGVLDDSMLVLTSDHGESFGEHAHWEHSRVLYEDLLHVPFILRLPAARHGGTVQKDVIAQPTDILPTALSVAGLAVPRDAEGRDLTRWIDPPSTPGAPPGVKAPGLAFAEVDHNVDWPKRWGARFDRDLTSARTPRWKYIRSSSGAEELFDLDADPGELSDLARRDPATTTTMRALVEAWRRTLAGPSGSRPTEIDEGLRENLRSLGYIQ